MQLPISHIVTLDVSPTVFGILTFKAGKWLVFPPLPCLTLPLGGTRQNFWMKLALLKLEGWAIV